MPRAARIKWMFTSEKARAKAGRASPVFGQSGIITVQRTSSSLSPPALVCTY